MTDVFQPIKQKKLSEEIMERLKAAIISGSLAPGEKLPSERDMAKFLGVSRVSLREALTMLQALGLVEIQQGNRSFVRPITTLSIYDPLVAFSKESRANKMQIFEIRKFLEMGITKLAAERAAKPHLERLGAIIETMAADLKADRLGAQADIDFHTTLSEAAQNFAYSQVVKTIYNLLQEELRVAWGATFENKEIRKQLFEQHKAIYEAVKNRDPQRAYQAAFDHLTFVGERWHDSLKDGEEDAA